MLLQHRFKYVEQQFSMVSLEYQRRTKSDGVVSSWANKNTYRYTNIHNNNNYKLSIYTNSSFD